MKSLALPFKNSPFRERCEELRIELLDIHQKKVCEERRAQIAFNEELRRRKLVEEQMFAKLWEEDRLAKEKREAEEARRQKELVENTRLGLNAQITGLQAQRRAAQQLKEEEARFLVGQLECLSREDQLSGCATQFAGPLLYGLPDGLGWFTGQHGQSRAFQGPANSAIPSYRARYFTIVT